MREKLDEVKEVKKQEKQEQKKAATVQGQQAERGQKWNDSNERLLQFLPYIGPVPRPAALTNVTHFNIFSSILSKPFFSFPVPALPSIDTLQIDHLPSLTQTPTGITSNSSCCRPCLFSLLYPRPVQYVPMSPFSTHSRFTILFAFAFASVPNAAMHQTF